MSRPDVTMINPTALRPVTNEPGLVYGQHFLFVESAKGLRDKARGYLERGGTGRTLPLWGKRYDLDRAMLAGPNALELSLACIATDKDIYREGDDAATIVVIDPARPDEAVSVEVTLAGRTWRTFTLRLDWNGMAVRALHDLVAGAYEVRVGDARTRFEVAAYTLAPMSGSARETVLTDAGVETTLDLSSLSKPVSGRVRVVVLENGKPVHGPVELESLDGVCKATFPLTGAGPFVAHVTGVDDPGLDTQVPLRGTAREERKLTWLARLGAEFAASVLELEGGQACRGLWIREEGRNNAPVKLERAIAEVGRLEARVPLSDVVLTVVHTGERRIVHRVVGALEPGQSVEFGVQSPWTLALIGGFAGDRPWEGMASLLPPSDVGLEIDVPQRAKPRAKLPVTVRTARPRGESSVFLVVRDARLKPMDHPLTRLGAIVKESIEKQQAHLPHLLALEPPPPPRPPAPVYRPPVIIQPAPVMRRDKLGEMLLAKGFVDAQQIREALARQKQSGKRIGRVLIEMCVITERDLIDTLSSQLNVPFVDLANHFVDPAIAKIVPEHICQRHEMIPINKVGNQLSLAMADPLNVLALDDVGLMTGLQVKALIATPTDVQRLLQDTYGARSRLDLCFGDISDDVAKDRGDDQGCGFTEDDAPIIKLVNLILTQAVTKQVHVIEILAGEVWHEGPTGRALEMSPPAGSHSVVLARLRNMLSADGVLRLEVSGRSVDMQVQFTGTTVRVTLPGAPAPERDRLPEVVFAGLVHVHGQAIVEVPLGDALGQLEVDAFVMHRGDWEGTSRTVEVARDTFAELTVPELAYPGDPALGRLDLGWASAPVHVELTCDGRPVPLPSVRQPGAPGRETLTFPLTPGEYRCVVRDGGGAVDRTSRVVTPPGTFRGLARTVRVLVPGQALSAADAGAHFLRVLPGPTAPFRELCEVTAGFEHLCCEQTAAKIMAAMGAYLIANSEAERQRLESIVYAGVERERMLWMRGQGLKLYPRDDRPSVTWGKVTVERLLTLPILAESRGVPPALKDALAALDEIGRDCAKPCGVELAPSLARSTADGYRGLVAGSLTPQAAAQSARQAASRHTAAERGLHGEVLARVEACHAAATLMRIGTSDTLREALGLVDWVGRQRAAHGGFYSTHDSAAAITMLHELSRLALLGGAAARARVDGKAMRVEDAARLDQIETLEAIDAPVLVEVGELYHEDWTAFRSNLPVSVKLTRHAGDGPLAPGDRARLDLTIEEYREGDLAHVCLPPGLARLHGGGRVQAFSVDFEGKPRASVELVAVGGTTPPGGPHRQHYFACVRNMFEAERIGNPGLLDVAIGAASPRLHPGG